MRLCIFMQTLPDLSPTNKCTVKPPTTTELLALNETWTSLTEIYKIIYIKEDMRENSNFQIADSCPYEHVLCQQC